MMELPDDPADAVDSKDALVAHILSLRAEFLERGDQWENTTLERYLEALAAWIDDSDGWYRNFNQEMPQNGDWTLFARAMSAAVVYE